VGTHLVTCQAQPSLGCVYKLVEINNQPKIKLSQDAAKVNIPGRKNAYRLYGRGGYPLADLITGIDEDPPREGNRVLCCHPYEAVKRTFITPSKVENLLEPVWDGRLLGPVPNLEESRAYAISQLAAVREDHLRQMNPTPYKVSLSEKLYDFMHKLWTEEVPPGELE
jgi:nicotinate phosphoribosyltransferase